MNTDDRRDAPPDVEPLPDREAAAAPPGDAAALVTEDELWRKVEADPGVEDAHKAYVGHILRHNLLRQAARRYGPLVDAKEKYSVEQRRLARQYQQVLLKTMFLQPRMPAPPTKGRGYRMVGNFMITVLMLIGAASIFSNETSLPVAVSVALKLMFPAGAFYLAYLVRSHVRQIRERDEKRGV